MKQQNNKTWYQLFSAVHAPFSKQTLNANLADRVTQINAALSAFYRFVFKKQTGELKTVVSQHYTSLRASDQQDNVVIVSSLPERAGVSAKAADPNAAQTVSGLQLELFF